MVNIAGDKILIISDKNKLIEDNGIRKRGVLGRKVL